MNKRGITIQHTSTIEGSGEALFTITYHETGSDPVTTRREWYWGEVLGIQHRWIFDGVQTH